MTHSQQAVFDEYQKPGLVPGAKIETDTSNSGSEVWMLSRGSGYDNLLKQCAKHAGLFAGVGWHIVTVNSQAACRDQTLSRWTSRTKRRVTSPRRNQSNDMVNPLHKLSSVPLALQ
jgi:hypothetical protein